MNNLIKGLLAALPFIGFLTYVYITIPDVRPLMQWFGGGIISVYSLMASSTYLDDYFHPRRQK